MTTAAIREDVFKVVAESTETEAAITEETGLIQDMGLSSIEVMILVSDLEEHFNIRIAASRLRNVRTVGDLCGIVADILL